MEWTRPVAILVVLLTALAAVGSLVSIVTTNPLLLDSTWQLPAIVTLVISVAVAVLIALAGRPSEKWRRTPYW